MLLPRKDFIERFVFSSITPAGSTSFDLPVASPKEAQNKIAINDRMSLESPWKVELVILQCFFEGRVGEAPTVGSMFILVHVHQKRHAVPAPRKGFRVDEPLKAQSM